MQDSIQKLWEQEWEQVLSETLKDERNTGYTPEEFYASGRATKEFPKKEDSSWWAKKGPAFVKTWVNWRDASGLEIWTTPDGEPAIELDLTVTRGSLRLVQVVDRIMVHPETNTLFIVDLKTGSSIPGWPRQLALNNLGLQEKYGVSAKYGGFWKARQGTIDWIDLTIYHPDWLWDQVAKAREIRDLQLFVAQPTNLCKSACAVALYCPAVGGPFSKAKTQPSQHAKGEA